MKIFSISFALMLFGLNSSFSMEFNRTEEPLWIICSETLKNLREKSEKSSLEGARKGRMKKPSKGEIPKFQAGPRLRRVVNHKE